MGAGGAWKTKYLLAAWSKFWRTPKESRPSIFAKYKRPMWILLSAQNELVVATVLKLPKLTWFSDTGAPANGHVNRLEEIRQINDWIVEYNSGYGNYTTRFHRFELKLTGSL